MSGLLFIPSIYEYEFSVLNTKFSILYVFIIIIEFCLIFILFKYFRDMSKVLLLNKYKNYYLNTHFYKAVKEANAIPTINPKVEIFHNNFYVRVYRVIAGISFIILGFSYYDYYTIPSYLHTILFIIVMIHLIYSIVLCLHSLYYIIKALIRGDFLYRK